MRYGGLMTLWHTTVSATPTMPPSTEMAPSTEMHHIYRVWKDSRGRNTQCTGIATYFKHNLSLIHVKTCSF